MLKSNNQFRTYRPSSFVVPKWAVLFWTALLFSAGLSLYLIAQLQDEEQWARHTLMAEVGLATVLQLSTDIETGSRGFALTGDPSFLEPEKDGLRDLPKQLQALQKLLGYSPAQLGALDELRAAVEQHMQNTRKAVAARQSERVLQPPETSLEDGKRLQDTIRRQVGEMRAVEFAAFDERRERVRAMGAYLQWGIVLSCVVLAALGLLWWRAVAERALAQSHLRHVERRYRHIFTSAANGMAVVRADAKIETANPSYCRMLGYTEGALDGVDFHELKVPGERPEARAIMNRLLSDRSGTVRTERRYLALGGEIIWLRSTISVMDVPTTGEPYLLVVAEDITEKMRNEERLRKSEALVRNAGKMAGIDGWSVALAEGQVSLSDHGRALLGLADGMPVTIQTLLALTASASQKALLAALVACRRQVRDFDLELEARKGTGEAITLRLMGQAVVDAGHVVGVEGALQDITPIKRSEQALRRSEQRFRAIARVTNDAIWEWDVETGRTWLSESMDEHLYLGAPRNDGEMGDPSRLWLESVHPQDREHVEQSFLNALQGNAEDWAAEYRYRRPDGLYRDVADKAKIVRDEEGRPVRAVGGLQDLTERKRIQLAMMKMAASVPMTRPDEFFGTLLRNLVHGLDADAGCIARLRDDGSPRARTLAVILDGDRIDNFDYLVPVFPLDQVTDQHVAIVADETADGFARIPQIGGLNARAYVSGQLVNAAGRVLGFIYVMFRLPPERSDFMRSTLQVFATRATVELERLESDLRLREQGELLDHAQEAIAVLDLDLNVRFWNRGAERMYGWSRAQALGMSVAHCYADASAMRNARDWVLQTEEWQGEFEQCRQDGTTLIAEEGWTLIRTYDGEPHSILKIGNDVSQKKAAEEEIRRLAYYDNLTGLPNRRLFMDRLARTRTDGALQGGYTALLFIDMDNFKSLNDVHGHNMGDEFLRGIAQRLTDCVRTDDTVARLGGDEFIVILENLGTSRPVAVEQSLAIAADVLQRLAQPFVLGGLSYRASASLGITLFCDARHPLEELLRQADSAMYKAKAAGRNTVRIFEPAAQDPLCAFTRLSDEIEGGLQAGEFVLWYQPQVDREGALHGAEALLRWQHPRCGLIPPSEFIAQAEHSGHIVDLGDWVLRRACTQLVEWAGTPGMENLRLSINVSVHQLRQQHFAERVLAIVADSGADPSCLMLEVTESVLDDDMSAITRGIEKMRAVGIKFSLDDFGIGYSSLARLRQLPLDEIKIDRAFVREIARNAEDAAIAVAILTLARTMKMQVVAEGVEEEAQLQFLLEHGCMFFQGYLFARPMPQTEFAEFVARTRRCGTVSRAGSVDVQDAVDASGGPLSVVA